MTAIKNFNIYLSGVGGQGIGLLSEAILRAADYAGYTVKGVDTHGLAQRGGIVVSQIRIGSGHVHSPLVPLHHADLLISLERHEALRALVQYGKKGGVLIYYSTVWQPLDVRLARAQEISSENVQQACDQIGVRLIEVFEPDLEDTRMQNIALLKRIEWEHLVPEVSGEHYRSALKDLMGGSMLKKNLVLFDAKRDAG